MEEKEYESVKVSGANVQSGTNYKDIKVAGASKFVNDIVCNTFKASGAVKSEGSIKANFFSTTGALKIGGTLDAKEIKAAGGITIGKDVVCESAKMSGSITIKGKVSAKEFFVDGEIKVGDELLADKFELKLNGESELQEVYGDEISITKEFSFGFRQHRSCTATLIEATTIELEGTQCKKVSGDHVKIGEGCVIDLVEYTTSIDIHKKAKVMEQLKIE